jgi:hypothetical protein
MAITVMGTKMRYQDGADPEIEATEGSERGGIVVWGPGAVDKCNKELDVVMESLAARGWKGHLVVICRIKAERFESGDNSSEDSNSDDGGRSRSDSGDWCRGRQR